MYIGHIIVYKGGAAEILRIWIWLCWSTCLKEWLS